MQLSNLLPLISLSAAAEVALYTADSGVVAHAVPARAVNCGVVTGALAFLKVLGGPATSFCSSYLHIGTTTVTNVITPPTSTITVLSFTTTTATAFVYIPRRNAVPEPRALPGLSAFAAAEITSACKCLQLPSKSASVTITATTPITTATQLSISTTTFSTCAAPGMHCDCGRPQLCCNHACSCAGVGGVPVSTCI